MAKLNITQAAKAVGISRQTMNEHLKTKGISVERDDNGKPLIDTAELLRVYGSLQSPDSKPIRQGIHNLTPSNDGKYTALQAELEALRAEKIAALEARAEVAERRADEWREQAQKWQLQAEQSLRLLADQRPAPSTAVESAPHSPQEASQRGFWGRLLGW